MSGKLFSFWWGMLFISSYAKTGSGAQPSSHYIDIRVSFLGIRRWGVKFITHLHLVQRLRMGIRVLSVSRGAKIPSFWLLNFGNGLALNMAHHCVRLHSLRWRTFMWGYRDCLLGKVWCGVQEILLYKLLHFLLREFSSSILYVWLSHNTPLTIYYITKPLRYILKLQVNCTCHVFYRNCLPKHVTGEIIEGMIDVTGRQRGCKLILGDLREMRGFWKLKAGAVDCTLWRMCF